MLAGAGGQSRFSAKAVAFIGSGRLVPGAILCESSSNPVPALALCAAAITVSVGKSVLVLAIWVETRLT